MSSLADLPEIVGFFSYSREDDEASRRMLSALRDAIQGELSGQLGRSKATFRLWQDQAAIAPGQLWESQIKTAIEQAVFFIPIVTPRAVNSHHCKFEFEAFLARERALGRADLVFPLLYTGNDEAALANALAIGAGHTFLIFLGDGFFPVNVLAAVRAVPEVCRIYCATANPTQVIVAQTELGRGVLGVVDGASPLGVETDADIAWRKDLLRKIGYKL